MSTPLTILLQREWMQHHRGWLALGLIPVLLMALALVFGTVSADVGSPKEMAPAGLFLLMTFGTTMLMLCLAALAVAVQIGSLARRDQQDRSIEFWLSLPVAQGWVLTAMVLMHLLLLPLMVMLLGLVGGLLLAPVAVLKGLGWAGLASLPWGQVLVLVLLGSLRLFVGVVLAAIWALPFALGLMAASAWLKRWGAPVLIAALAAAAAVLKNLYGMSGLQDTLSALGANLGAALIPGAAGDVVVRLQEKQVLQGEVEGLSAWLMQDLHLRLLDLASPLLLLALAVAALGAWAVLVRRQRGH